MSLKFLNNLKHSFLMETLGKTLDPVLYAPCHALSTSYDPRAPL